MKKFYISESFENAILLNKSVSEHMHNYLSILSKTPYQWKLSLNAKDNDVQLFE